MYVYIHACMHTWSGWVAVCRNEGLSQDGNPDISLSVYVRHRNPDISLTVVCQADGNPDISLTVVCQADGNPDVSLTVVCQADGNPDVSLTVECQADGNPDISLSVVCLAGKPINQLKCGLSGMGEMPKLQVGKPAHTTNSSSKHPGGSRKPRQRGLTSGQW